jgi:Rhodopirellula transposase DDE domain
VAEIAGFAEAFAGVVAEVAPVLEERVRRLLLGAGARVLGRGGIKLVAVAMGVAVDTVRCGAAELDVGILVDGRGRAKGVGRKLVEVTDPGWWPALDRLVDSETGGDPMSRRRWTTKSRVKRAEELTAQGDRVGPHVVARLLKDHDYSFQGNAKTMEGRQHPDREAQFRYLNVQVTAFLAAGLPVISVGTKKKENLGADQNGGREYQPKGGAGVDHHRRRPR